MYQTVGTNLSIGIAEAMEKPLLRRKIGGKAKITNLEYEGTEEEKNGDVNGEKKEGEGEE